MLVWAGVRSERAIEFTAGPEDAQQDDEGAECAPMRPEWNAGFEWAGFGQGVDFFDEIGDLGGLDDAAARNAGHFIQDFRARGLAGFFDFHALGEQGGFEWFVFGSADGSADFPCTGEIDFEAAVEGAPGGFIFLEVDALGASVGSG